MAEDVWGDDDDGDLDESHSRQRHFHTLGYRDGVSAGKESSAQKGFNAGFRESVVSGFEWGVGRGITSAFAALGPLLQEVLVTDKHVREHLQSLHSVANSISSTDAIQSYHKHLEAHSNGNASHDVSDSSMIEESTSQTDRTKLDIWPIVSEIKTAAEKASINFSELT